MVRQEHVTRGTHRREDEPRTYRGRTEDVTGQSLHSVGSHHQPEHFRRSPITEVEMRSKLGGRLLLAGAIALATLGIAPAAHAWGTGYYVAASCWRPWGSATLTW